ncbi:MAG: hypothetical protein ACLFQU_09960 [Candidatus Kapaibacterium sp.]
MKHIYDSISRDELTPDLQLIADICGLDTVRQLLKEYPGMNFYIPKVTRLDSFVSRIVRENKDSSIKHLALKLGVSEQYLRILRKKQKI